VPRHAPFSSAAPVHHGSFTQRSGLGRRACSCVFDHGSSRYVTHLNAVAGAAGRFSLVHATSICGSSVAQISGIFCCVRTDAPDIIKGRLFWPYLPTPSTDTKLRYRWLSLCCAGPTGYGAPARKSSNECSALIVAMSKAFAAAQLEAVLIFPLSVTASSATRSRNRPSRRMTKPRPCRLRP
jgi:hypothetical protein